LFGLLLIACAPIHAATVTVVDFAGKITGIVNYDGFNWQPPPGSNVVAQITPPMEAGGTLINGVYTPPPPMPPPPSNSVAVVSTSNAAALNGTYAFDMTTQSKILAVSLYVQVNGKFPAGQTSFPWPDAGGTMHMFTSTSQFQALADYTTALDLSQAPAAPIFIP
jgi:hypothetical protein